MPGDIIKVTEAAAPATYVPAGAEVAGNRSVGVGLTGAGVRPTVGPALTAKEVMYNGVVDKATTVTGQGGQFAQGFSDLDKDGAAKAAAAATSKAPEDLARSAAKEAGSAARAAGGGGGLGGAEKFISRLTGGDVAKLLTSPYQSVMPMAQTAPQLAQQIPQMLSAPLQAAQSALPAAGAPLQAAQAPVQSILSTPAGAQLLQQLLSRASVANGFDGGPASLPLASSSSGGSGGRSSSSSGGMGKRLHAIAKNVLGIPYAWGGGSMTGPSRGVSDGGGPADRCGDYRKVGFDCSGLSRYVTAKLYGVEIPKGSQAQFAAGVPVSRPVPGDLVYRNFHSDGPHHVQVYIGNGQVLEAPSSGQTVKISPFNPEGSVFRRFVQLR